MLIAEDLLLLLTDDNSGQLLAPADQVDVGLGGAMLVELTMLNRVDLSREGDDGKPGRIIVRDPSPTGDEVLDGALRIVLPLQGKKPAAVVKALGTNLRRTLYERLASSGVIRAEKGKILGVFPRHTWPSLDNRHESEVRGLVIQALVQQTTPDTRTAALIALLHALRREHLIVFPRRYDLSKRELRARAEEIARGSWASDAVRKAIDDVIAAVAAMAVVAAAGSIAAG
jgi:hypothetical protein